MYKSKFQLKTLDRIIPILTYRKTYLYMKHKRLFGFKQPNVIVADQNNSLLRRKRFSYVLIDETVKNPESIFRYCNNNYLMLINAK